jgi:hypothetical protein
MQYLSLRQAPAATYYPGTYTQPEHPSDPTDPASPKIKSGPATLPNYKVVVKQDKQDYKAAKAYHKDAEGLEWPSEPEQLAQEEITEIVLESPLVPGDSSGTKTLKTCQVSRITVVAQEGVTVKLIGKSKLLALTGTLWETTGPTGMAETHEFPAGQMVLKGLEVVVEGGTLDYLVIEYTEDPEKMK